MIGKLSGYPKIQDIILKHCPSRQSMHPCHCADALETPGQPPLYTALHSMLLTLVDVSEETGLCCSESWLSRCLSDQNEFHMLSCPSFPVFWSADKMCMSDGEELSHGLWQTMTRNLGQQRSGFHPWVGDSKAEKCLLSEGHPKDLT